MTRDLTDLMHENVAARESSMAGLEPTASVLAGTARRVRRRRALRRTLQVGGAGTAVVVLGAASWLGWQQREAPVPADTPTPSASATPRSSATPAPSPTASATLDEIPGLPPTTALPPGLLAATTPGWVLTVYRSEPSQHDLQVPVALVNTVVLVSPTGERYRVVDLPLDTAVSLLRWDAGSTTAVVSIDSVGGASSAREPRAELDLETGTLTPTPLDLNRYADGPWYHGLTADGDELWSNATSTDAATSDVFRRTDDGALELVGGLGLHAPLLDPTKTRIATSVWGYDTLLAVIDVRDGHRTELEYGVPGKRCDAVSWLDEGSLLVVCADRTIVGSEEVAADAALYRFDIAGASTQVTLLQQLADGEPIPERWGGATLTGGRTVVRMVERGADACDAGAAVWDGRRLVPLLDAPAGSVDVTAAGGVAYVRSRSSCQEATPAVLTAYDVDAGTSVVVAPQPEPTADVPQWAVGMSSWAVRGVGLPTR
ncbi:hypothetical protein [Cellulomonas fimi]|uniref:hypothetical protein n=1 Tax=Cellulomonas fimi TaxID=1708 RepID=UPI002359A0C0|nr:hypothetical protein [Cellulomonas fimi]